MNTSRMIAAVLKGIYDDCNDVVIISGHHSLNHAHFHLIPHHSDQLFTTSTIPIFDEFSPLFSSLLC